MQDKLLVITCGHTPQNHFLLEESLKRNGLELHLFGVGKNWAEENDGESWDSRFIKNKLLHSKEYVEEHGKDFSHVLFLDGSDTLVFGNKEEILDEFDDFKKPFVISTEKNYYPKFELEAGMDALAPRKTPFKYINGGAFMGTTEAYIETMNIILASVGNPHFGDQDLFMRVLLNGKLPDIELDYFCSLFQSLYECKPDEVVLEGGTRFRNKITGMMPLILHWNGKVKGRETLFSRVYGI